MNLVCCCCHGDRRSSERPKLSEMSPSCRRRSIDWKVGLHSVYCCNTIVTPDPCDLAVQQANPYLSVNLVSVSVVNDNIESSTKYCKRANACAAKIRLWATVMMMIMMIRKCVKRTCLMLRSNLWRRGTGSWGRYRPISNLTIAISTKCSFENSERN